jgi:hypothetical protein
MGAVQSYSRTEDFWYKYSIATSVPLDGDPRPPERRRYNMTKIMSMLREQKKIADRTDADMAHSEFPDQAEFMKYFSYRKGAKMYPLKNVAHIARLYRKLKGHPRFWDFEDELEEDANEDES